MLTPRNATAVSRPTQFLTTAESSVLVPHRTRDGRASIRREPRRVSRSLSHDALQHTKSLNASVLYASSRATAALVQQAQALPDPVQRPRATVSKAKAHDTDVLIYEYAHQDPVENHQNNDDEGEAAVDDDVVVAKPVHRSSSSSFSSSSSSSIPRLAGYMTLQATIEEFQNTFAHRHTSSGSGQDPLNEDMAECELLYTLTNEPHKRLTIQRLILHPRGVSAPTRRREFVVIECQKRFRLPDGRQGWVQSLHSISVPSHFDCGDCVRGKIHRSGVVALESLVHKNTLDVIVTAQLNLQGNASRGAHRAVSKRRIVKIMDTVAQALMTHRVANMAFPGTHRFLEIELEQKHRACTLCADTRAWFRIPGWTAARHTCRKCGSTVCSSCSHVWAIERQRTTAIVGGGRVTTATRVCHACVHRPPPQEHRSHSMGSSLFRSSQFVALRPPSAARFSTQLRPTQLEFHVGIGDLQRRDDAVPSCGAGVADNSDYESYELPQTIRLDRRHVAGERNR